MTAPTIGVTSTQLLAGGDLVAQQCGPHVLIRGYDEAATDAAILVRIPEVPGNALVLASAGAHRHPGLLDAVRGCVAALRFQHGDEPPHTVWLAVSGLGDLGGRYVTWLRGLSVEFGVEVVAPHGSPIAGRGIGIYVNRAAGGAGWRRFSPGSDAEVFSCRFPMPVWEHRLPHAPLVAAGLTTEPVPAGLTVRPVGLPPLGLRDPRFQVPFALRVPKLVVGEPGADVTPGSVAEIIDRLPVRDDLLVVPAVESVTTADWAGRLAAALDRGIDVATGRQVTSASGAVRTVVCGAEGEELLEPLATVLHHTPDGAPPQVRAVAPPPAGWRLQGPRCYRPDAPSQAGVVAEVLPGGLHVRLGTDRGGVTAVFDPRRWTMVVGDERRDVTGAEVAAVCDLLEGLGPVRCRTVDIHVLGASWQYALSGFEAHLWSLGVVLDRTAEPTRVRSLPSPVVPVALSPKEITPRPAPVTHTEAAPVRALPSPPRTSVPPLPITTVSGPRPQPKVALDPGPAPEPAPSTTDAVVVDLASVRPEVPRPARTRPIEVSDRASTPAEQARLGVSAGSAYTEALAAVNVALSAWPMLRAEAKADYVAVCLYLGRGPAGAVALDEEGPEPFDGYLPCLVSGLRRLPTHRKVLLRQENRDRAYPAGTILWEPGFLSASAQLDVTTPTADRDLLIWPVSARRTSELLGGRAVDEAVFAPGRRFKALAVRTHEPADDGVPHAPRQALLVRELLTDEDPESAEALARDAAALPRLDRAWEQRQQAELRLVDDEDAVARLTAPMALGADTGWSEALEAAS